MEIAALVIAFAWVSGGLFCIKRAMESTPNADALACLEGVRRRELAAIVALCGVLVVWPVAVIGARISKLRANR